MDKISNEKQLSDFELVAEFKNGNDWAFDELVKRYQTRIYQLAFRMVGNSEDAWELAQDTFIRAYNAVFKFKKKSSFYTWLYRICVNLCLSFIKKKQKQKSTISFETLQDEKGMLEMMSQQNTMQTPTTQIRQQKLLEAITNAINQLPMQQRLVFMMRQYDDMKNEEIAEVLKISPGGVKANYHQAILKLKEMLKDWL
ncbi:MAG: RNA polymerase sigma factor [candidate division WOR-3 bacterium]|nr:RNA polymerase sigma factor [candidate division WOR-3 bacterium]